jgi:alkylation response protein AidB-like acyl-CoA dehydrogenase
VSIAIGDDHLALADTVRRFTTAHIPPSVPRTVVDAAAGAAGSDLAVGLPVFWDELVSLGWLGLHLPDQHGGSGYGFAELVVVVEELGRAVAPGPFLPTVWASAVLALDVGGTAQPDPELTALVRELAEGRAVGAVALGPPLAGVASAFEGHAVRLTGTTGPVLCGPQADVVVVPVEVEGTTRWCAARRDAFSAEVVDALDGARPLARLTFSDGDAVLLAVPTVADVEAIGVVLAAAEGAGVAAWCVETAAAHASVRRQFGRPIGQFQAVKHRCADMLVALEQTRAVAWDAAAALDDGVATDAARLAAAAAGAVALDAGADVAKDCIQVLGGIGFTWEHDAHLYLRRALVLRQLFGGSARWRQAAARAAVSGARRDLHLDLPESAGALRSAIGALADGIAAQPKEDRRAALAGAGLIVPHWDPPWGRGAGAVEQLVIDEELRRVRVRVPHLQVGAWAAPTIAAHGTPEQQERWVRPTLLGTIAWCQLFSEPEAGSDLAALTTRATRVDGGWSLTGQKVWTSMAKEADWGICLARTNPSAPKHLGITYFIVDMRTPGIDIRPLREITGMAMFNEVFFDDVFVPDDCVIGEVDGGWPLARTTLANERVSMGSGSSFGGGIEALLALVAEQVDDPWTADPHLLDQVGALVAESHSLAVMGLRQTAKSLTGAKPGSEASVRKLLGVEHDQRTQELGLSLLGAEGATTVGAAAQWTFGFLANRCLSIAGGTSEIQRNVIAERLLGLPRDPEPTG